MTRTISYAMVFGFLSSAFATNSKTSGSVLPFELYEGHIILAQAPLVGTKEKLNVMIDTGASHSVISRKTAKRIKTPRIAGPAVQAGAFDGGSEVERVIVRGLRFAGRTLTIACYSAQLPWDKVDLILGLDVLRSQRLRIDYQAKQLVFSDPTEFASSVPFDFEEGLLLVRVQIGKEVYRLSIDSGAPMTSLHRDRCAGSLKSLKGERAAIRRLGGTSEVQTVTLPDIQIGDKRFESAPAMILRGSRKPETIWDGVIGIKSLGLRAVQFDFDNNRMSWEKHGD
jgi:hypothetical protein